MIIILHEKMLNAIWSDTHMTSTLRGGGGIKENEMLLDVVGGG